MPPDSRYATARLALIDQMIEQYRLAKRRRLLRRAIRLWRQTGTRQQLLRLDARAERVH